MSLAVAIPASRAVSGLLSTFTLPVAQRPSTVTESPQNHPAKPVQPAILHICKREMLRPLRDQILRISGYHVDSTITVADALTMFSALDYSLVLIDVEGDNGVAEAEQLCTEIKSARPEQLVAFVCNWRVAVLTDCPDEIVRTEFDPAAFVAGVRKMMTKAANQVRPADYGADRPTPGLSTT